jgi:hypothetical protein
MKSGATGGGQPARNGIWRGRGKARHLARRPETGDDRRRRTNRTSLRTDFAVLLGLAGVAVTQPLLDLLGSNPTFFVAGNYSAGQISMFAVVVAVAPSVVLFAVTAPFSLIGARWAELSHGVAVAVLAGLFGLALTRTLGLDALLLACVIALALGITAAIAEQRVGWVRRFLLYLAPGNVIFLVLFLLASPSAELLGGASSADVDDVQMPQLKGPVVVVVLDEFPVTSLIDSQGRIIEERYPNFAALAEQATWFRNAASESKSTYVSVPSILSGVRGDEDDLPSYRDYPNNYFSLLGVDYPINRYEPVSDLCPPDICAPPPRQPLRQAVEDAMVVYGHRVLPASWRNGLPAIDRSWGNFGDDVSDDAPPSSSDDPAEDPMAKLEEMPAGDQGRIGQAQALRRQVQLIGPDPSVNFMHFLLPHHPYVLNPWSTANTAQWIPQDTPAEPGDPGYEWAYRELYALQALQIGAVDQMIGELVDHLRTTGVWEDALLVVTSDHGIDISPPKVGRTPSNDNTDELFRVPLFIKAPGQMVGETRDDPATTVDILPSIADLLDVETDAPFDGHSLFDGSKPSDDRLVKSDVQAAFEVAESHASQLPGESWEDLTAVGVGADLVGQPVDAFEVAGSSELAVTFDDADLLKDLSVTSGKVPYWLRGSVQGRAETPPELAVAVNGTFAGTVGGYRPKEDAWRFSGVMANRFVDGANEVVAYEVEQTAQGVVLHPVPTE